VLILIFASVTRNLADIETIDVGSSCANLAPGEGRELFWVVLPTRILVAGWIGWTGLWLCRRIESRTNLWVVGALVVATQFFIGVEALVGLLLVPLWAAALVLVIVAIVRAVRRRQPWAWVWAGWLVLVVSGLPIMLLLLTSSGEVSLC
jgi:hypothetical protein